MQIQHEQSETVNPAAYSGVEGADCPDIRLERLVAAREADRIWRAKRKAEHDNTLHEWMVRGVVVGFGAMAVTLATVPFLVPRGIGRRVT